MNKNLKQSQERKKKNQQLGARLRSPRHAKHEEKSKLFNQEARKQEETRESHRQGDPTMF